MDASSSYLLKFMLVDLLPEVLAYGPRRHSSEVLLYEHLPESVDSRQRTVKGDSRDKECRYWWIRMRHAYIHAYTDDLLTPW